MYAVLKTGGKQYRVHPGQILRVEKLELEQGQTVTFDDVLLVVDGADVKVGSPTVAGASVTAEVVEQGLGKKIRIIKFKRRKNYLRTQGHRQAYTAIKITDIQG